MHQTKEKQKLPEIKKLTTTYTLKETILELITQKLTYNIYMLNLSSPRRPVPTHLHQLKTEKTFYNLTLSTVNSAAINSTEMDCLCAVDDGHFVLSKTARTLRMTTSEQSAN